MSVEIPNSVTYIGRSVFYDCTGLMLVKIPNSVTYIGGSVFYGCTGLTSVEIPNSVTYIGSSIFYGCTGLTSVKIPDSVTIIGNSAFSYCTSLKNITIPESVTSIGDCAFSDCLGLTSIKVLNPECEFGSAWSKLMVINDTATIYGYENSTAQEYAEKYGNNFVVIGSEPILDGDSNGDGTVNVADAVMLQKWLLGSGNLTNWKNADLCEDGRIDVFDMVEMRKLIANK